MTVTDVADAAHDPARADSPAAFAACLRALVTQRGMTYRALAEAAERLPTRDGRPVSLPRSTASDILTGKRAPTVERLLILLSACGLAEDEREPWLTAWRRIAGALPSTLTAATLAASASGEPLTEPARRGRRRPLVLGRLGLVAVTALLSAALTTGSLWAAGLLGGRPLGPQRLLVITDNWTHTSPDASPGTHIGWDTAGWHLFYCWTIGAHLVVGHEASDVWVLTDDDAGHRNVYINELYLANGSIGSLPLCHS
jgi:transcriptional regulator with XRE-family HTH domain